MSNKNHQDTSTRIFGLYVFFFLFMALMATVYATVNYRSPVGRAQTKIKPVTLLTDGQAFRSKKTVLVDFSEVDCCRVLENEYEPIYGVVFENDLSRGWSTYQANGFAGHLSMVEAPPGAPVGISGTRLYLPQDTDRVGFYVQAGSPFDWNALRPAKSITVRAYDRMGELLIEQATDTCLEEAAECRPQLVGVRSASTLVRFFEVVINERYGWSLDSLMWLSR